MRRRRGWSCKVGERALVMLTSEPHNLNPMYRGTIAAIDSATIVLDDAAYGSSGHFYDGPGDHTVTMAFAMVRVSTITEAQ